MSEIYIDPEFFKEIIIVGGGTCGLAVCARLCEKCPGSIYTEDEHQRFHWLKQRGHKINLLNRNVSSHKKYKPQKHKYLQPNYSLQDMLVLDELSDRFMGQWDSQFKACNIPYLRSPMFFHLDPVNVDGMVSYAHLSKRENELMEIENVVGKEYSKHQFKKQLKKKATAKKVPAPNAQVDAQENAQDDTRTHNVSGLIDINMRDWKDYYRPSTPLFHDYCHDIITRYNLHNVVQKETVLDIKYTDIVVTGTKESGKGFVIKTNKATYGCKICILATGHKGKTNYPIKPFSDHHDLTRACHTSHIFQNQVKFPPPVLTERKSSSLVIVGGGLTAAQLAHVAITLGVSKVYMLLRGPLKIKHFDFHLDWVTKYKNLKKSAFYIKDTDEERLAMIQEARQGGSINPEYHKKLTRHLKSGRLQMMKHTTIEAGLWNNDTGCWDLSVITKSQSGNGDDHHDTITGDYVVFATGNQPDIKGLPFMKSIISQHDIKTVQGFPCLTDNLEWKEGLPLFVIGKNASLKVGPSSANLDGARLGAERIGWFIQDQKLQGKYDWNLENLDACSYEDLEDSDSGSEKKGVEEFDSFNTQLKLASGQLNWYSLLQTYN